MRKLLRRFFLFVIQVVVFLLATAFSYVFFTEVFSIGGPGMRAYFPLVLSLVTGGVIALIAHEIANTDKDIKRGERLVATWKVKLFSWWKTLGDPYPFFFGGVWYPHATGEKSLAAVGAPGTGKTVNIRLFLQSTMPRIGVIPDHRALIYDASNDSFPVLAGMGIDVSEERGLVRTLHPFDQRAWAWEISLDLQDFRTIDEIAVIFIPIQETGDPFWSTSARSLLKGVLKAHIASGKPWTLYDVCTDMRSLDRMKQILEDTEETRHLIERILEKGKASEGIDATLYSYMERYEVIAAIWNKIPSERRMSITEWLHDPDGSILLLGRAVKGTAHDALNQLFIERLGQIISTQQTLSETRRTWIVIDEIRQSGKLKLDPIATMGRGRGAILVIGYQDQAGLRDAIGADVSDELLGMCQSKLFFYLGTASTAEYAAQQIGRQEYTDENGVVKERFVVYPSEFTSIHHIPETNRRNGCTFYVKSVTYGVYKRKLRGRRLFDEMLRPKDTSVEGFIERPASDQYFLGTVGEPEKDTQEREMEKPRQIEYVEPEKQRDEADERANAARDVRKRQKEARDRRRER
jgi:hypothetical protein